MQRNTNQRQVIINYLQRSLSHPTAEQIFKAVRRTLPHISLGTVYRNLKVLEENGEISSLTYHTNNSTRYESRTDNHYHFICQKCDKVVEVELDEFVAIEKQVARRHKLLIDQHQLFFFGLCVDCQKLKVSK